ncbi:SET domain-containing protein [Neobacillus sp. NRS-1170]|uniref:SET domain-containing protein n=1 Tax=Neobacillus sp. NRS-1170 TaxID=3233898 RepID=UPI003D285E92
MGPICVKKSDKYVRGVFAVREIKNGELIEQAPIIVFPRTDRYFLKNLALVDFLFDWGEKQYALALGYGSIYNHSYNPNAKFEYNKDYFSINFYAIKDISAGEEISINHNNKRDDNSTPLWFQ